MKHTEILYNRHNPGNTPPLSKSEDPFFSKTNETHRMKVNITRVSMYHNLISLHSVISISLTQSISDLMLVVGRCRDIAVQSNKQLIQGHKKKVHKYKLIIKNLYKKSSSPSSNFGPQLLFPIMWTLHICKIRKGYHA